MALPVGSEIEVVKKATYKHKGATYELPEGMRGYVTNVHQEGDVRVQWMIPDGGDVPMSEWLLQASFPKVRVLNPQPIPADFTFELERLPGTDPGLGLAIDMPGGTCLYVKEVMEEGLIPAHNTYSHENLRVYATDLIVHVNGIQLDAQAMLQELARAERLLVGIRRKYSSAETAGAYDNYNDYQAYPEMGGSTTYTADPTDIGVAVVYAPENAEAKGDEPAKTVCGCF